MLVEWPEKCYLSVLWGFFNIEYFSVHQYTFTSEVTILNPCSYHFPIRVSYELKKGGAVLNGVCDVSCTVTLSATQAIEAMMRESQYIWKSYPMTNSTVYHNSSLWRDGQLKTEKH